MELEQYKEIIAIAIMAILGLGLPFIIREVVRLVAGWAVAAKDGIEEFNPHLYDFIYFFAGEAVRYAEQAGLEQAGEEKLDMAVEYLQRELDERGFGVIDVKVLADKLELALFDEFNQFKEKFAPALG